MTLADGPRAPGVPATIYGVTKPQPPRPGRRHRKRLRNRLPSLSRGWLAAAAAVGIVVIVALMVPVLLGATDPSRGAKPAPTITVKIPLPQPTVTVTISRPGPTVTVTQLKPGPTVTVRCQHPGRRCSQG